MKLIIFLFEILSAWGEMECIPFIFESLFEASKLFDKFVIGKLNLGITKPLSMLLIVCCDSCCTSCQSKLVLLRVKQ